MRSLKLLPLLFLITAPAAAEEQVGRPGDPWQEIRLAQAGPRVIPGPRQARSMRDYDRPPAGRPDFAGQPPAGRGDLGGGFIEFLFTGRSGPSYARELPRPDHARPQFDMRDRYHREGRYGYEPPAPLRGVPLIQARREEPDIAAYPQSRAAIDPRFLPQQVAYHGSEKPGTIVIDSRERFLYLVEEGGMAMRYGVGVGRDGFGWSGMKTVTAKKEWPDWRPPEEMLQRQPNLPRYMAGGPNNPLGARALYLGDSLYRIHGSNEPWTIGQAVSSGCFRMRNEDVIDLYERVKVGTRVVVL